MSSLPERLPYSHDHFVNRRPEIKLVLGQVRRLLDGLPVERRTVIFHGQRGSGKSWLLQEIAHQLQDEAETLTVCLDLRDWRGQRPDRAVRDILSKVHRQVGAAHRSTTDDPSRLAEQLVATVKNIDRALIVLLDHVDESEPALLEPLEDHFLAPLANIPRLLFVLAGRGREYTWKSTVIRLKSIERDLTSFDKEQTEKQLAKQAPAAVPKSEEIIKIGIGFPWTNYLLSQDTENLAAALPACLEALLGNCLQIPEPPAERWALEALCILSAFSDEMIPVMLAAYHDDTLYLDWSYRRYRELRGRLIDTTLVKWDERAGQYRIDQALRPVLEHWLYLSQPVLWTRLHEAARDMFDEWREKYTRNAMRWRRRARHHQASLKHGPARPPEGEEEEIE